jgi:hypothetical protein
MQRRQRNQADEDRVRLPAARYQKPQIQPHG